MKYLVTDEDIKMQVHWKETWAGIACYKQNYFAYQHVPVLIKLVF